MKKRILLLGATGSIGTNTCSVVREFNNDFEIVGMSANSKIDILNTLCTEFKLKTVNISDKNAENIFKDYDCAKNLNIYEGTIADFVKHTDFDILVNALTGYAGFLPTVEAIKKGKTIALANKETLVVGGDIINQLLKEHKDGLSLNSLKDLMSIGKYRLNNYLVYSLGLNPQVALNKKLYTSVERIPSIT